MEVSNRRKYYHLYIDDLSSEEAIAECKDLIVNKDKNVLASSLFFINAHCFNLSIKDERYLEALRESTIVLNDGIGIKIGGKLKGIHFKENMNGTDFIPKLMKLSAELGAPVFLLGGKDGIAEKAKSVLTNKIRNINISGVRNGYFGQDDNNQVIEQINLSKAEILIVGMGVPRQEKWIFDNLSDFKYVKLAVAGGAILDFISGNVTRAPEIFQKNGLEWVWRLMQEPKRLFRRYLFGNAIFFRNILLGRYFNQ